MKFALLVVVSLLANITYSASINVRLVIQSGTLNVSGASLDYVSISESGTFQSNSAILIWTMNDDVQLKVVNLDSDAHNFNIDGYASFGTIAPGDSSEQNIVLNNSGVFRYFDDLNAPFNAYLGVSGVIHVKETTDTTPYFYWDIREHQESWNAQILGGSNPSLTDYDPEQYTINGNHYPNTINDTLARVTGSVGSEFKVVIVNNGLSIHSLHFHGYHMTIENDSKFTYTVGRSKDTFPIHPGEHLILSCTPDKEGEYPVHDHNLVAVTGGGEYSTGMLLTMLIAP